MTVECQDLKANGLSKLPEGIDVDFWTMEKENVSITERYFKWGDWLENDLKALAKAGVTGKIEMSGEEAEWEKYVLEAGIVKVYRGQVTYPKEPEETL